MFQSFLTAILLLSLLMTFAGCAKKPLTEVKTAPTPQTLSEPSKPVIEIKPEASETIEALIAPEMLALETVLFEYNSYGLTARAQKVLKDNVTWLLAHPEAKVTLEGHCDERGSDEYNMALGERRALSTKNYFVGLGVAPERLSVISYGEESPVSRGHNEKAWEQNRRVEFK